MYLQFSPRFEAVAVKPDEGKALQSAAKKTAKRDPENAKRTLVLATLDTIAEIGITDTTVSKIIERAELSRGMIHLHFGGKNPLLEAAARAFSEEYYYEVDRRIKLTGNDPEAVIMAIIDADLSEALMNQRSTRIWHAFRGIASSNSGIAVYSNTRDKRLRDLVRTAFENLAEQYENQDRFILARDATFGLLVLLEGMWVDYLSNSAEFSREVATSIVRRFIAGLFPHHFQDAQRLSS